MAVPSMQRPCHTTTYVGGAVADGGEGEGGGGDGGDSRADGGEGEGGGGDGNGGEGEGGVGGVVGLAKVAVATADSLH